MKQLWLKFSISPIWLIVHIGRWLGYRDRYYSLGMKEIITRKIDMEFQVLMGLILWMAVSSLAMALWLYFY